MSVKVTRGVLTVTHPDLEYYRQEPFVVECTVASTGGITYTNTQIYLLNEDKETILAKYSLASNRKVSIDLTALTIKHDITVVLAVYKNGVRVNNSDYLLETDYRDSILNTKNTFPPQTAATQEVAALNGYKESALLPTMITGAANIMATVWHIGTSMRLVYNRDITGLEVDKYEIAEVTYQETEEEIKVWCQNIYSEVFAMEVRTEDIELTHIMDDIYSYDFEFAPFKVANKNYILEAIRNSTFGEFALDISSINAGLMSTNGTEIDEDEIENANDERGAVTFPHNILAAGLLNLDTQEVYAAQIVQPLCGRRYILVRWHDKTHYFECKAHKVSADNITEYEVNGEHYKESKGRVDSFTLHLDNLTAFDVWYYSDIVTSSDVQVSFDDGKTWVRVQVTTKDVTIPDSDKERYELNININYSHYDAAIS